MADEKQKILCLMKVLEEETDVSHPMNAAQLSERVEARFGLGINRKTVYSDIEKLQQFGMDIAQNKGASHGYYLRNRDFDLPELKLLVDAVQSSKFITKQKSEKLIRKLEKQTSLENARQLQRQVFIYNRIKTENETIYQTVDVIHAAIHDNRKIRFKYCEWTVKKVLARKKGGADYVVSPWALTWDDENYYLVAYDSAAGGIRHYRVDKMQEISESEEEREGKKAFDGFDLAAFARKTFGMYGGEERKLTLRCSNSLAGVIIDRFGQDIMMFPDGENSFRAAVTVAVSPQFYGWLAGIGKGIRIESPTDVRESYRAYLEEIVESLS